MNTFWKTEWKSLALITAVFIVCFYLPVEYLQQSQRLIDSFWEALYLVRWYAQEHVLLCLIPAFIIAGAISVFISQAAVMKYLGVNANKLLAYGVASVSGTILAVCSCTVLPLFAGIYKRGAGLGPAIAFLYSGPAINVLAIVLTAKVLGPELGIARAIGAVLFSVVIGLLMSLIFRKEEQAKAVAAAQFILPEEKVNRPLWQNSLFFFVMVAILVFVNWGKPLETSGIWYALYAGKWWITGLFGLIFAVLLVLWFNLKALSVAAVAIAVALLAFLFPEQPLAAFAAAVIGFAVLTSSAPDEASDWFSASWEFAKLILPLLLIGVLIAGFLLGRPGHEALIPSEWITQMVGGNSFSANFFASISGAFMYFATLTEVPILQGLLGSGMGQGPALALLLAGPALSLPSMLVLRTIMGNTKTFVYVLLVVIMATITGMIYGSMMGV
ncbi:MAG: permease [Methylobacter sp.]|uniref:Permease n=1 Tax=Candidatus Methylobacter titanis TaxID=3053457 RepID=A0AA43Q4E1_9GAMM|nr:permease [Candidatus Methylobacter titanis]MDI1291503.1 permease [Candidatus Methylobacter titanis]